MVSKITCGKNIRGAVNYNENKVNEGKAVLLMAHLYPKEINQLSFHNKVERLQHQADQHEKKYKCLHVSLNFDPSEQLHVEKLQAIAHSYMQKIGFEEQPFLLYQHFDAAHPHLHIVTTTIRHDGSPIKLHNNWIASEKARKEIEYEFNLVPAESKGQKGIYVLKPVDLQKAVYGKSETKQAISNIVRSVVAHYKFTSLAELNAVLQQFNVMADRGEKDSIMYQKGGLIYSLLDPAGKKIGVPIKASSIYDKPTLAKLEKKFVNNESDRKNYKGRICRVLDQILSSGMDRNGFIEMTARQKVQVLFRQNEEGRIYGITYVDNITHCVFNGSDLGKSYAARGILERLSGDKNNPENEQNQQLVKQVLPKTDFTKGIRTVLATWAVSGLLVRAIRGIDGNIYYWMGSEKTQVKNFCPAGQQMNAYFLANGLTEHHTRYISDKYRNFLNDPASVTGNLFDRIAEKAETIFFEEVYNIIDAAFKDVQLYEPINYELLREARKKKRRRSRY